MSPTTLQRIYAGDTLGKRLLFYDADNVLIDPDTIAIQMIDPNGTVVDTLAIGDLARSAVGTYRLTWNVPAIGPTGIWTAKCTATKTVGTIQNTEKFQFNVIE